MALARMLAHFCPALHACRRCIQQMTTCWAAFEHDLPVQMGRPAPDMLELAHFVLSAHIWGQPPLRRRGCQPLNITPRVLQFYIL